MRLRTLHASSAVALVAFSCLHLANHLVAAAGPAAHIAFMEAARSVYRKRMVEPLLVSCVAIQVVSGLALVVRGWKLRRGFVAWLQACSGVYLLFFLLVHVGAVFVARVVLGLDTNFYFAAAGFHVAPFQFFFAPYYFLAVMALFLHLGCAAHLQTADRPRAIKALVLAAPAVLGAIAASLIVLSLAGALFPVEIPVQYKTTYRAPAR